MTKWNIDGHYHQVVVHDTWTHQPKKKQKNIWSSVDHAAWWAIESKQLTDKRFLTVVTVDEKMGDTNFDLLLVTRKNN